MADTYRNLDEDAILRTLERLRLRVGERFPGRGLADVCTELLAVTREHTARVDGLARPLYGLRALVAILLLGAGGLLAWLLWQKMLPFGASAGAFDTAESIESTVNILVLTGAGVWFLMNLEARIKRNRALESLHELRAFAHVIDMHQLTKDPAAGESTSSSPTRDLTDFQLVRYLDYCAEMLSLVGKVSALYMQRLRDPVVIQAANDIEDLTSGFAQKIWQKIMIVRAQMTPFVSGAGPRS
ncbi:MAG: hypothetical protein RLO80_07505 [Hyphomonas sp.]